MAQKIYRGTDQLREIVHGAKLFLVHDGAYRHLAMKAFFNDIPHIEFSDLSPNPLYEQVVEGVKAFRDGGCEMIVAVGGGSTIDVAKCIKLYCGMDPNKNYLEQEPMDTGIPLVAIPTTAGTGSESTRHAVIYFKGAKQSISHPSIIPDCAILVPSLLKTLPVYQKKCTMLDALCQGIESWWSVNSTDESMEYSRLAVEAIKANWRKYIEDNAEDAAAEIMEAANYAGRAINITATTAPHAMSYKLTSLYGLPHGHAVAVCMPEVWSYMLAHADECVDSRGEEHLRNVFSAIPVGLDWFKDLMEKMGLQNPVSENRKTDLEVLTKSVNPVRLKNNPVALGSDVLYDFYERIVR